MFDIDDALRYLIVNEGSDLHLKVPAPPIVRVHGRIEGWKLVLVLIAVFALVSVAR